MGLPRVVVTGLGAVTSIGIGKDAFWNALIEGRSGVSNIERFDSSDYDIHIAGEVKDFRPGQYLSKYEQRRLGRAGQFAAVAARLAVEDARLDLEVPRGAGVCLGTTLADAPAIEHLNDERASNSTIANRVIRRKALQYPSCMLAINVAKALKLSGKVVMIPTACAAGNYAIAYGSDLIRLGKCDMVLAGGVDPFSRYAFTGFSRLLALASDCCRPFDLDRKGTVIGEGAGMLVLESLEYAQQRKANPYAEVLGYGMSCDAHHMTIPSMSGVRAAMRRALEDAQVTEDEVDYISAHGTGTPANDRTESAAISEIFGHQQKHPPVSSIKSMLGHTMGAASALEAISCVLAIRESKLPPTINFVTDDPACPIDCVPNKARKATVAVALNNSFAFGGNNACVVFGKLN